MFVSGDYCETRTGFHELGYLLFGQREIMMMSIHLFIYRNEDILDFIKTTEGDIVILQRS